MELTKNEVIVIDYTTNLFVNNNYFRDQIGTFSHYVTVRWTAGLEIGLRPFIICCYGYVSREDICMSTRVKTR